ncbi:sugar phosphate isomerase/epimerase [Candidatus Woesearchaeota archaeon]|nr:sugar phosphate isomerase/epimerase [Candidatus Woesearchaeota archaeon]
MIYGDYYNAMDRYYGRIEPTDIPIEPTMPVETSKLGPKEIGTGTNPMTNQLAAFNARIREGAGKIEFEFLGQGKTNSQRPGPEASGAKERQDMRDLAEINDVRTSVHASWHQGGLAGLGQQGFNEQIRQEAIREIEKAIHFAAEATKGGAVVFHSGEWQRPLTDLRGDSRTGFIGYPGEAEKTPIMVVDKQTGEIEAIRRDQLIFEPKFFTAADYEKERGIKLVGTTDKRGNIVEAEDWIDTEGNAIKKEWVMSEKPDEVERLFDRVPVWNSAKTNFEVEKKNFESFKEEADRLSKKLGKEISPEVLIFKSRRADEVSQSKGSSLFYAKHYEHYKKIHDAAVKALAFYEKFEGNMTDKEKWHFMMKDQEISSSLGGLVYPTDQLPTEFLKERIKATADEMRHIHESSATADARAQMAMDRMKRVETVENYGLKKTAETMSHLGMKAYRYSQDHAKELEESIYVAPENWDIKEYGSHPDEMKKIIKESRKKMVEQLMVEGLPEEEAQRKAKEHIKATLDVGHFNLWRSRFERLDGESMKDRDKRFDKWLIEETKKLAKEGIVGHIHLSDNFGYDDEHLTPGEGNTPMKEFIKNMEEAGLKDFIVEAGSFNVATSMPDTWAMMGSPIYGTTRLPSFRGVHQQHFGYHNPAMYIVGAYAPSNEWHLWSEVPLE